MTPWTVAHQAPLYMKFPRQEYWSRLPFPSSGDLPDSGIEPASPAFQADSLLLNHQRSHHKYFKKERREREGKGQKGSSPKTKDLLPKFSIALPALGGMH